MAENPVKNILTRLGIEDTGKYENHFYIINLDDSDAYAKMYTKLNKNAINAPKSNKLETLIFFLGALPMT